MASKVNVRFVAILVLVLSTLAAGVVYIGLISLKKTAAENAANGDEAIAAGDVYKAVGFYSKAVAKAQQNPEYLRKWIGAMEQYVPLTRQRYQDDYQTEYRPALTQLAFSEGTNIQSHDRAINEFYRNFGLGGANLASGENVISVTESHMEYFPETSGPHDTLLRYPGMVRVAMMAKGIEIAPEDIDLAREHLQRALAAKPSDGEVLGALATWHVLKANRLRADRFEASVIEAADREAQTLMDDFIRAHPPALRIRLARLGTQIAEMGRTDPLALTDQEAVYDRLEPEIDAIFEGAMSQTPESMDRNVVAMVTQRFRSLGDRARVKGTKVVERALEAEKFKNDASLLLLYGRSLAAERRTDEALVVFERVSALPDLPLSLDGLVLFAQRHDALQAQCEAALARWEAAETDEGRAEALARAGSLRDTLLAEVGDTYGPLLYLDARLAYINGKTREAKLKLQSFNELTGDSNRQAVSLLGRILLQEQNYGGARDQFERVLELSSYDRTALAILADIANRLEDREAALGYYRTLQSLDPENEQLAERIDNLEDLLQGGGDDPVLQVLSKAQELGNDFPPDVPAAKALIRDAITQIGPEPRLVLVLSSILSRQGASEDDFAEAVDLLQRSIAVAPQDVRLVQQLATTHLRMGDKDAAILAAEQAVARNPENEGLQQFVENLKVEDPVQQALTTIDEAEGLDEFERRMLRFRQLTVVGRTDEAAVELDAAAALRPEDPLVVMQLFERARIATDRDEMRRLSEIGRATNADGVDGLTFRAMVQLVDGKLEEAVRTMERALDGDPLNPRVWAGLGKVQFVLGRAGPAEAAYQRALDLRPQDVPSAIGLVRAIVLGGDYPRALERARELRSVGRQNPEFLEMWLTLESEVPGGDRLAALRARQRIVENRPDNLENAAMLARLLIEEERYEDADPLLTQLLEADRSIPHVDLRARWFAMQGDLDGAARTFMDFAGDHPDDTRAVDIYSVAAQLYIEFERPDIALSILEQGRPYQTEVLECDRDRAKVLFEMGRHAEAELAYAGLLESLAEDPGNLIRIRLVEALLRQEKYSRADEVVGELGSAQVNVDSSLLLLRAEIAAGLGDRERARKLYDEAIAAGPENPASYLRRARFNMQDREMLSDVEADLEQALRLRSGLVPAMAALADLYLVTDRPEEAVEMRTEIVRLDPANVSRRIELSRLLLFRERGEDALRVLGEGVAVRPRSVRLLNAVGEMAMRLDMFDDARLAQGAAWELRKDPQTATLYVKTLLEGPNQDPGAALAVLADPAAEAEQFPSTLLLRARAKQLTGRLSEIEPDIVEAYRVLDSNDREQVGAFFQGMAYIFPNPEDRAKAVMKIDGGTSFSGWMGLTLAEFLGSVPAYRPQAVELLTRFAQQDLEPALKLATHRRLGGYYYSTGDFEGAVSQFRAALEAAPDNPGLLNDLAYTLGSELRRVDEAMPIAEEAAKLRPQSPNVLDTLGTLQMLSGDLDEARSTLERAVGFAGRDVERVPLFLHLAQVHVADNNDREARRYLDQIDEIERQSPGAAAAHSDEVADLRRRVGG